MKKFVVLLILLALASTAVYVRYGFGSTEDNPTVNQASVSTGTIVQAVRAIGTLQPIRMVRVGSQVSGTIDKLNVDFNSVVTKGQVLAQLDPSLYEMQVAVQQANIARQETDIARQKVELANLQTNLDRARAQLGKGLLSPQQLETADLKVKTLASQIAAAEKMKVQAEAQLTQAKLNVSYCTISSPIDGVVVNRMIDIGQTVQARMNAPLFFMIAAELTTLRLQAGVDEADIGYIRPGMPVTFTVDGYRGQTFPGRVEAVRLNAQIQNSVVTYPVWIEVPNADLRLRPNMTANLQIIVDSAENVARVPLDALKFRPTSDMYSWLHLPAPPQGQPVKLTPPELVPVKNEKPRERDDGEDVKIDELFAPVPKRISSGTVWIYEQANPDPARRLRQITVRTGVADANFAELVSGELKPGVELLTGVMPPPSYFQRRTSIFGQPQRGFGGMTPGGPKELPTLQRGGGPQRGGGGGRGRG